MKTNLLSFLIFFTCFCVLISCQQEAKTKQKNVGATNNTDSLYLEANAQKANSEIEKALEVNALGIKALENDSDSIYAKFLRQRIVLLGRKRPLDSAIYYANKLLDLQRKNKDTSLIADGYYLKSYYFDKNNSIDSTLLNAYRALQLFKEVRDSTNVALKSRFLSAILSDLANYEEAEVVGVEGIGYITAQDNAELYSSLCNSLAIITKNRENYNESLYWYIKALEWTESKLNKNIIQNNIAVVYLKQGKYQNAFQLLNEIKEDTVFTNPNNTSHRVRVLDNWAYAKSKLNHIDAEKHLLEALELRKKRNIAFNLNASYIHLAEHYADRNDLRALSMAKNALKTAKTYNNPDDQLAALSILIDVSANPRPYAILYRDISDSIHKVREQAKTSYAKLKYDVTRNRQENTNLKAEAKIRELEISQARLRNLVYVVVIVILLLVAIWRHKYVKNKHRREKEKAIYDTELGISKKVHDELANDAFNILLFIQNETISFAQKTAIIDALDSLYKKTRDIAREFNDIKTGIEFEETLKSLLSRFNTAETSIISKGIQDVPWSEITDLKQKALYRVLQELLINMKKHSGATLVILHFKNAGDKLSISYSDNGVGIKNNQRSSGNGIRNMENRIDLVNGKISFDDSVKGCKVKIEIPY
ncbi:tetratricopeptide repeat protein [Galbibacter sp. BG1]|uniref:tetratricopeptide repeat-containing sensor histidine kinase n=1 Tax=Galbibacter sp. BG1 TaxID=1170699 RepID=UPI0015C13EC7|nr:tetratricopeptide repeat-containing sensor histidine kinase [Galbibacter sp. BG1]QLE01305.1 tetratricopeptide repeat protein [Galbibacter sp. BG1]